MFVSDLFETFHKNLVVLLVTSLSHDGEFVASLTVMTVVVVWIHGHYGVITKA